jgi:hypothetical protein
MVLLLQLDCFSKPTVCGFRGSPQPGRSLSHFFFFLQFVCNIGTLRSESTNSLYVCMYVVSLYVGFEM